MRKECQCYSEYRGNCYFYFNLDAIITFYDKILLIVWPQAKGTDFTVSEKRDGSDTTPVFPRVIDNPKDPEWGH